ncbi:hypothetical protein [Paenibacillus ginsengarvi]|uniref:Uncharacterized protein n=1 Tax=Paenibacillus ginsengarvi TaxID=400777 RepID=A0A3B0BUJ5_9BACL|nr:hypothetical protein [Paenibacillus ginsengarvi]RKN75964.1 hypothetical protein D7M11_24490 [Paenibacillus ginsengarvi]
MRKSRYYPFERNRYFYGKLLTVRDFDSEQKYFNDKRRMMNRLLFGPGVITGLQVIAVDDKSVSVEMGAAIDALGREIIVPAPVTMKLSMMEGFTNNEYAKNVYLCLAYDEKGKEPVHSIANSSVRADEVSEYNRVLESYRLFIREEAPEPSSFPLAELTEQTVVLYQDAQVRVLQTTPKYVNPGHTLEAVIRIEKTLQAGKIELEYELATDRLEALEGRSVRFSEPQDAQETEYEFRVELRADALHSGTALVGVKPGSSSLRVGDKQLGSLVKDMANISIVTAAIEEQLMDDYLKQPLEAALDSPSEPCLYLAKISLLQMGPTYVIERVEQVPFDEYVYNPSVSYRLALAQAKRDRHRSEPEGTAERPAGAAEAEPAAAAVQERPSHTAADQHHLHSRVPGAADIQTGTVDIAISPFAKSALSFGKAVKSFVSPEIEHGLGTGDVLIVTSVETSGAFPGSSQRSYFGAADVFTGSEFESGLPEHQLGAVSYPDRGTFRVGIKLGQVSESRTIRIRWWAYRNGQASGSETGSSPDSVTLSEAAAGAESKNEL